MPGDRLAASFASRRPATGLIPYFTAGYPSLDVTLIGLVAALISGLLAIRFMLEFLKRRPLNVFIAYRVVAAIVVFIVLLSPHGA